MNLIHQLNISSVCFNSYIQKNIIKNLFSATIRPPQGHISLQSILVVVYINTMYFKLDFDQGFTQKILYNEHYQGKIKVVF